MFIEDSSAQTDTVESEEQVEPLDLTAPLVEVVSAIKILFPDFIFSRFR